MTESAETEAVAGHRQVAALVAAADRAGIAPADLPAIRARLLAQQQRLARTGQGVAMPTPSEISEAGTLLGNLNEAAVSGAFRTAFATLDVVDASLGIRPAEPAPSAPVQPASWPPPARMPVAIRNAAIYGGFTVTVAAVQFALFLLLDESSSLPLSAPLCLLILPAFAWLAGFVTIGVVFRPPPGAPPVRRSPRLGAIVCLIPNLVLCALVGAMAVTGG